MDEFDFLAEYLMMPSDDRKQLTDFIFDLTDESLPQLVFEPPETA